MTKIMLVLDDNENKIVEAFKVINKIKSKNVAIKRMINQFSIDINITKNVGGDNNGIGNRLEKVE